MKSFFKFLAVLAGIFLLSVVLTPIFFKFLPFKFEKIFNRLVMIFSLTAAAFFVRIDRAKLIRYGLIPSQGAPSSLSLGFLSGVIVLTLLTAVKIFSHVARWDLEPFSMEWLLKPLSVFLAAFLIGFLEEIFFRGIIFRSLTDKFRCNTVLSVLLTSVFYSAVHFVSVKKPFIGPNPGVTESFKLLMAPLASFSQWPDLWRAAVGLFIFGVILNALAIRSRSLYTSIGLHAGCVFFVKLDSFFVEFSNDYPFIWGSAKMYDSLSGWIALSFLGVIVILIAQRKLDISAVELSKKEF